MLGLRATILLLGAIAMTTTATAYERHPDQEAPPSDRPVPETPSEQPPGSGSPSWGRAGADDDLPGLARALANRFSVTPLPKSRLPRVRPPSGRKAQLRPIAGARVDAPGANIAIYRWASPKQAQAAAVGLLSASRGVMGCGAEIWLPLDAPELRAPSPARVRFGRQLIRAIERNCRGRQYLIST